LLAAEPRDKAAKNAPKDKVLDKWDLGQLIKVAVELKLVEPVAETLANAVRQYRNLVHPDAELRNELRVEKLEADSGLTVFRTVCRDLERVHPDRNRRHARIVVPDCPRSMIRWSPVLGYRRDRCFGGVAKPIRRIFESMSPPGAAPPDPHPLRQPRQRRKQRAVTLRLAPDHKQTSLSTSPGEHAGREAVE
jgi:hypothetical protein